MNEIVHQLVHPERLYSRNEVIGRRSMVPAESGIYAWYFRQAPSAYIDLENCWHWQEKWLLYVGISPKEPTKRNASPSKNNMRKRIRDHMKGNAYGSTLRLSLGCLLSKSLGTELRRVGHKGKMTFADKEAVLSEWLDQNAVVTWVSHSEPWVVEREVVPQLYLPLNLSMNLEHPFYSYLYGARESARETARQLPELNG